MSTKSSHPTTRQRDPDFVKAETAIKRASLKARERARKIERRKCTLGLN